MGSLTRPISDRKSDQAPKPAASVASAARAARTTAPTATAIQRRVSSAHASTRPGWILIAAPSAPVMPSTTGRSRYRQPTAKRRNSSGPTCPSFTAYRNGHEHPASRTISHFVRTLTGIAATPTPNAPSRSAIQAQVAAAAVSSPSGRISGMNVGG